MDGGDRSAIHCNGYIGISSIIIRIKRNQINPIGYFDWRIHAIIPGGDGDICISEGSIHIYWVSIS